MNKPLALLLALAACGDDGGTVLFQCGGRSVAAYETAAIVDNNIRLPIASPASGASSFRAAGRAKSSFSKGARYGEEPFVFWTDGTKAFLEHDGKKFDCELLKLK
jgi:membrane-bound inhibitor of C-type lysozyme